MLNRKEKRKKEINGEKAGGGIHKENYAEIAEEKTN
jgi:hypothetical protein